MTQVSSERLTKAIGRGGSALSVTQENLITKYVEENTSGGVVPRDYHSQSAVHFIDEKDKKELLSELRKAGFNTDTEKFEQDDEHIAGSGLIVKADRSSVAVNTSL